MTRETCGVAWQPSFFLTSCNRVKGRGWQDGSSLDPLLILAEGSVDRLVLTVSSMSLFQQ